MTRPDGAVVYTVAAPECETVESASPCELSRPQPRRRRQSVGIAVAPRNGSTWEALLSRADAAMYVAKRTGTGVEFYAELRDDASIDKLAMLAEFRTALDDGDLVMFYQPVYSLGTGAVVSTEALVRWPHPERGMLVPDEFLPVASRPG